MEKPKVIVTGAYGAIGKAIAKEIAQKNFEVNLVGRDSSRLASLCHEIIKTTGNPDIFVHSVNLSCKEEIKAFSQQFKGPLHILINNAATTPRSRLETPEGLEMQFATNVLGYVWMMEYFYPLMKGVEDARIVNVASYWAGDLQMDDLEFKRRLYHNDTAYRQSKQANRMLTGVYARKFSEYGISVLAVHPGDVNSKLSNNLGYGGWESPEQGAANPVFCATDPAMKGLTGLYLENKKIVRCEFMENTLASEKLFEICCRY